MFGVLFALTSQLFVEVSTSMGKYEVEHKKESLYAMGFLNLFWISLFLFAIGFFRGAFHFDLASLPTFTLRAVLEVVATFVSLNAVLTADRSTFAFLHTLTIPLVLCIDIMLGYTLSGGQLAGIALMICAFIFLFINRGLSSRGKALSLASAALAAITISLYKYDITHFNSVEAEQALMTGFLTIVFVVAAWYRARENVFRYLTQPVFLAQSVASGLGSIFMSFAYVFAPASVIISLKRAFEVLISIISGRAVFHEKNITTKAIACILIATSICLVAMG